MSGASSSFTVLALVVGLAVGSFIGAASLRTPRGKSVMVGRSRCDQCHRVLRPYELLPVVSYLVQRGRCRRCGREIAADHLIAELGGALVALVAVGEGGSISSVASVAIFGWLLLLLGLLDWRHFWLPNAGTGSLLLLGLVHTLLTSPHEFTDRISAIVVGFCLLEGIRQGYAYLRGVDGLGAGDPKLFAGVAGWFGLTQLPWLLIAPAVLGMVIYGAQISWKREISLKTRLPFGSLVATTGIFTLLAPSSKLIISL